MKEGRRKEDSRMNTAAGMKDGRRKEEGRGTEEV